MGKTSIEWTDLTDNPIRARNIETGRPGHFCVKISPGCRECYAERWQMFRGTRVRFSADQQSNVELFLDEALLKRAMYRRKPCRIFVCDMTDLFGEWVPEKWIDRVVGAYDFLPREFTVQFLTKRADRMAGYFLTPGRWGWGRVLEARTSGTTDFDGMDWSSPAPQFHLGFSAENQEEFNRRWPHMVRLADAGWKVWCSMEPLLGPIDPPCEYWEKAIWTVTGGESGPLARPSHPDWFRDLRDSADDFDHAFFFKQWGEWRPRDDKSVIYGSRGQRTRLGYWNDDTGSWHEASLGPAPGYDPKQWPGMTPMNRVGRNRAGRLLDGKEHSDFPKAEG